MSVIQLMGSGEMVPAPDPYSAFLVEALPLNLKYGIQDQSFRIRGSGSPAQVQYLAPSYQPVLDISTAKSKYYGSSAKESETNPAGTTFFLSEIEVNTGSGNTIGTQDYCYELWWYTEDFDFAGQVGWQMNYNRNSNGGLGSTYTQGDVPQIIFKGDNWVNVSSFLRGVRVGAGPTQAVLYETSTQVFLPNTWHHVATTRSGTTGRVFVDGIQRASGTDATNYQGYINVHGVCNRTLGSGMYFQDVRVYIGTAKYTSNFTPPGPIFT